ncbi:protamine-2-like [Galleria mellonella]|uniref:Protamine-2-like n=1 Tax=Galleria mellonella TaxID=7137 RepID=A0A6J1X4N7_GALME|nr:protamine-2-like [Galleria mellonella]
MVSAGSNGMETDEDKKKKINDDVVVFLGKRSENEAPRYAARLKTYVTLQQKRRRAAAARRHSEHAVHYEKRGASGSRKKIEGERKEKAAENTEQLGDGGPRRSFSRLHSCEPVDRGCRRRKRRRRRSCRRPRRRHRSCRRRRRRSSSRRRRRSSSRRRRRRSCRRRRIRRRRCR